MPEQSTFNVCEALRRMVSSGATTHSKKLTGDCRPLITPVYLLRMAVAMVRQFFSQEGRIPFSDTNFVHGDTPQHSGDKTNHLFIGVENSVDFKDIGGRPAVFVGLGDIEGERLRSLMVKSRAHAVGVNVESGSVINGTLESTSWIFRCCAASYMEAWALSHEVKAFWQTYSDPIVEATHGNISEVFCSGISKPEPIPEYKDSFCGTVVVNLKYQDSWDVSPDTLPVQTFHFDFT